MKSGAVQEMLECRPFQPFEVRMTDGKTCPVRYPNYAVVMKSVLFTGDADSDDSFAFCAFDHIANINVPQAA